MKHLVFAAALALLAVLAACSTQADSCPSTDKNLEWSSSCFAVEGQARRVKPQHAKNIVANQAGHAAIMISHPRELVVVDHRGVVTIPNILATGDFDYPNARDGLARFRSQAKCGYFDTRTLRITIPARYDDCQPFKHGVAEVCNECLSYCTEPECQDRILVGGQGFSIDRQNAILRRFTPPSLANACAGRTPGKLISVGESGSYLQCPHAADAPFGKLR